MSYILNIKGKDHPFNNSRVLYPYWGDYSYIRLTLDRKEDLKLLNIVYRELEDDCSWKDVVEFLLKQKNLLNINKHIEYNEKTESLLDE